MIRLLRLLLLLLWPFAAQAETIIVRGGEHAEFTRLVMQSDAAKGWSIEPVADGWDVRIGTEAAHFDVTRAWRLIKRRRLTELKTAAGGRLRLVSDCDCHIRRWEFNGLPVIDVYDGTARPESTDIARLRTSPIREYYADKGSDIAPTPPASPSEQAGLGRAVDRAARRDEFLQPGQPEDLTELAEDARRRAETFEASLREVLDGATDTGNADRDDGFGMSDESDLPSGTKPVEPTRLPEPAAYGITADGRACPDPAGLDPSLWVSPGASMPNFSSNTSGLYGEFDALNPEVVLSVARYYLYFGFGVEARQLLTLLPTDHSQAALLSDLGDIFDSSIDGPPIDAPRLEAWQSCPSVLALWSLLVWPEAKRGDIVATNQIVLSYQSFPAHLRQLVGPKLIAVLLRLGDAATADRLRNLMSLTDPSSSESVLASAKVDEALGARLEAKQSVDQAISEDLPDLPDLLLKQAVQRLASGAMLPSDQRDALEALAFEYRQQPLGAEIHKALADAEILAGDYLAARKRLEEKLRAQDLSDHFRRLYHAAADQAEDAEFLRLTLPDVRGLGVSALDISAKEALANRMNLLGFPNEALALLVDTPSPAGKLISAAALLKLGRADEVTQILDGRDEPEALALLAEAREVLGDLDSAQSLYLKAGLTSKAASLALMAGNWQASTESSLASVAKVLAEQPAIESDEPYDQARQLLARSASERAALEALLPRTGTALSN